ncbi:MAG: polysaccharide deacetylase family protein [Fimbriimonadaceae bacterium]|nr:polysaccharide deacetylase family protein [Fimbriimonadaceae bacterium]QYK57893.1 MAG: polysaccharide deacetylase family protein [Fimbriimonadaceae bacterium]
MATGRRSREDKGVVSLTYDGTLTEHGSVVFPQLEAAGLKATFYAEPALMLDSIQTWRAAQAAGHEIGNGCLVAAALPDGSLPAWTPEMIADDIEECGRLLAELFPSQGPTSFAYPLGEPRCADYEDYRPVVEKRCAVCRSGETGRNDLRSPDLLRLRVVPVPADNILGVTKVLERAFDDPDWVVLSFETVDPSAHQSLIDWLTAHRSKIEIAPLLDVAQRFSVGARPKLRLV